MRFICYITLLLFYIFFIFVVKTSQTSYKYTTYILAISIFNYVYNPTAHSQKDFNRGISREPFYNYGPKEIHASRTWIKHTFYFAHLLLEGFHIFEKISLLLLVFICCVLQKSIFSQNTNPSFSWNYGMEYLSSFCETSTNTEDLNKYLFVYLYILYFFFNL